MAKPRVVELRAPLSVQMELTETCNYSCVFCYNVWKSDVERSVEQPVDLPTVKRVIDALVNAEVFEVSFTGGEPLVYKHFMEAIDYAHTRGLGIGLSTNGSLVSQLKATQLRKYLNSAQVSLHGSTAEKHDGMVGYPGGYDKTVKGIKNLANNGISVSVNMTVVKQNLDDLFLAGKTAKSIGASMFTITRFIPSGAGKLSSAHLALDIDDLKTALASLARVKQELDIPVKVLMAVPKCAVELPDGLSRSDIATCNGGLSWCTVAANGNIRPCPSIEQVAGNVLDMKLSDIWRKSRVFSNYRLLKNVPSQCKACRYISLCLGGCRAAAIAFNGTENAVDPICDPEVMASFKGALNEDEYIAELTGISVNLC